MNRARGSKHSRTAQRGRELLDNKTRATHRNSGQGHHDQGGQMHPDLMMCFHDLFIIIHYYLHFLSLYKIKRDETWQRIHACLNWRQIYLKSIEYQMTNRCVIRHPELGMIT